NLVSRHPADRAISIDPDSFVLGALAPDSGYLGSKDSFHADLAHNIATSNLSIQLLNLAVSKSEFSFALGWISHAILDRHSHPIINTQSATVLGQDGCLSYADNPSLHTAIELGVDATWIDRVPSLNYRNMSQHIPAVSVLIASAYLNIYGLSFQPTEFRKSLFRFMIAMRLLHIFYRARRRNLSSTKSATLSRTRAILSPFRPESSFQRTLSDGIECAANDFLDGLDTRFRNYENFNLDTGVSSYCDPMYSIAVDTLTRLNKMRKRTGLPPLPTSSRTA
ncbi:MAG: zinc dependent phospholipase C family protein, partial [Planctomycetes bacterium]|nr:zinc dependent phospholipase C family protein [Planctomycetota bacterium]